MLKIKFLFIAVLILSCPMFAQNLWTSETAINFTIPPGTKAASFVDANGVHIVYSRNGGIRYALVNSNGVIVNSKFDKVIEADGSNSSLANVAAIGSNVYAIYYKNNDIKVAKSTNLGDSWNNTFSYYDCINTGCNKVVAYSDVENIHITWSELRTGSSYYRDVHYVKFIPSSPSWSDYKRVSDIATQYTDGGENPDLVFYSGKVYTNYIGTFHSFPINRDRNINNAWNNPEEIPFNQFPSTNQVKDLKPLIVGSQINTIYKSAWSGMNYSGIFLSHSYKNVDGTSWTQNVAMLETDYIDQYTPYPNIAANTQDGKIHLIYWDKNQISYSYRTLIGQTFSNHIANIPISSLSTSLNANSNDLYLIRTGNISTNGNILFRHYDTAPLAPANYSVSAYQSGTNYYPRLTWTLNNEPDVRGNSTDAYKIERRTRPLNGTWSSWSVLANLSGTTSSYIDYSINNASGGDREAEYRITAVDEGNNPSTVQSVTIVYGQGILDKTKSNEMISDYSLEQNYPNPFNPSTKISYSIKEEGLVTLKVYDVLGKEVATLVNEHRPAGNYEVEFNASQLPSGMYIYKIQAGSFTDVKKMILTK
jgi:hypothetical protein